MNVAFKEPKPQARSLDALAEALLLPVSYTHLDVYKRQVLRGMPPRQRTRINKFTRAFTRAAFAGI